MHSVFDCVQVDLQLSSLILAFHFLLHLGLGLLLFPPRFLLLKLRVQTNSKHGTILAPARRAVVAARAHVARYNLLVGKESPASVPCLRCGVFALTHKPCLEVNVLPTPFDLKPLQLIIWNVVNTVYRACLDRNLNRFVVVYSNTSE